MEEDADTYETVLVVLVLPLSLSSACSGLTSSSYAAGCRGEEAQSENAEEVVDGVDVAGVDGVTLVKKAASCERKERVRHGFCD